MLIPDSAHGTNPASTALAGFSVVELKSEANGDVDLVDLERHLSDDVAAFMITQPNTLGLFESKIHQITEMCHAKGVQVYMDGANFNAILGITRPGDLGFDVCHFNLHKTFTTPHGSVRYRLPWSWTALPMHLMPVVVTTRWPWIVTACAASSCASVCIGSWWKRRVRSGPARRAKEMHSSTRRAPVARW